MIPAQKKYKYLRIVVPYFIFFDKCKIKNPKSKIIGNKAGYILKLP